MVCSYCFYVHNAWVLCILFSKCGNRKINFRCVLGWTGFRYMTAFKTLGVLRYWRKMQHSLKSCPAWRVMFFQFPLQLCLSESSFCAGSRVLSKYRSRLLPSNVQALIFGRNWLCGFEVTSKFSDFILSLYTFFLILVNATLLHWRTSSLHI